VLTALLAAATDALWAQAGTAVSRIVVPFAAGGAREMPARAIQQELGRELTASTTSRCGPCRCASACSVGISARQGSHQLAQKGINTTLPRRSARLQV